MIFQLDSKINKLREVTAAIIFAAVFSALCLGLDGFWGIKSIVLGCMLGIFLSLKLWYFPRLLRETVLSVENGRVYIKKGLFFKREYSYPNREAVYIQAVSTPLASAFGLRWAILRGAGHSLFLPPLNITQLELLIKEVGEG